MTVFPVASLEVATSRSEGSVFRLPCQQLSPPASGAARRWVFCVRPFFLWWNAFNSVTLGFCSAVVSDWQIKTFFYLVSVWFVLRLGPVTPFPSMLFGLCYLLIKISRLVHLL